MRQVFIDKGILSIKNVAEPILDDYSVIVQVHYSCISSGTEQATIAEAKKSVITNVPEKIKKVLYAVMEHGVVSTASLIREKLSGSIYSLGYSCSGQVIAVGKKIASLQVGDYVSCAGAGYAQHADIVCVPEHLVVKISNKKNLSVASSVTLGAIALQGIRRADIKIGDVVSVIGLGLLGQMTVQLAKLAGATVFGIDIIENRLSLALSCGSDQVYNGQNRNDTTNEIAFATNHHGVDVAIITAASSSNDIVSHAIELTRKKGKIVLVGDVGIELDRELLYKKEIDFLISCSYGPGRYDPTYEQYGHDYPYAYVRWTENRNMQVIAGLIESGKLNIHALLPEVARISVAQTVYQKIQNKTLLGAILSYCDEDENTDIISSGSRVENSLAHDQVHDVAAGQSTSSLNKKFNFAKLAGPVRVGVIGAGGFAKIRLLPILSGIKNVQLEAIVDINNAQALTVARTYKVAHVLSDYHDLFTQDLIDVAVIASPHIFHADQAIHALSSGKAVFLEKPMVTTFEQLNVFRNFFATRSNPLFCVDYNRSFSPFMQSIKKSIEKRSTPLMVNYRMNAGYIPAQHWVQTDVGAGRIIGEACHIFDLFAFLTDARPLAVSVEAIHGAKDALFPTDNFSVQVRYDDGSLCTLFYTAMGNVNMGKERMELFFDGKTIVMDDYKILKGYGLGPMFNKKAHTSDKGHNVLLQTFFNAIREPIFVPPILPERLLLTAELSLTVDLLVCKGGGEKNICAI
jgi:predicted dehydrogenase/threonine dehydrogenase-like Zn-dependent dehydrogenase